MSGSTGLPAYRSQVALRPVGPPGMVSVGDGGASGLGALSQSLQGISSLFERDADQYQADRGIEAGRNAVIERDAEGRPVPPELRRDATPYGRSFDVAARQAFLDTAKQDAATDLARLATEHRNTPEAFLATAQQRIATMVERAPPEFRNELAREYGGIAEGMGRQLLQGWATAQYQQAQQAWATQAQTYGEEWRLLMLNGEAPDSPAVAASTTRLREHLTRGVLAGHISPEQRDLRLQAAEAEGVVASIAGEAGRIADAQGPEAATRFANDMLSRPEIAAAGDRVVSWARAEVNRRIYESRVGMAEGREEVRAAASGLAANQRNGVDVPMDVAEGIARRAEAMKLPGVAREVRALARIGGEVRALRGAGLQEIRAAYQAAITGDSTDPLNGMRAQQFGQMLTQQVQALQHDPVGWAQAQPRVRDAVARAARGEGTAADVVRAQDAVLGEQGVSVVNARILPRSRVEQIVEEVRQAPASTQAAVLERTFSAYPPEFRYRIWNDLRNGDIPENLRPAMLLMTSERSRAALPIFMQAATMTEAQRTAAAGGEGEMRDLREAVSSQMETLRGAVGSEDAKYLADASQAVLMVAIGDPGGSARDRAGRAYRMVVEGHTRVERAGGSDIRIPLGVQVDVPKLDTVLRGFMRDGLDGVALSVPAGAVPERPGLTEEARREAYLRSVGARGRWTTLPDGTGVVLRDGENRPVRLASGQLLIVRYGEEATGDIASLRAPALPQVQPPAPAPAREPVANRPAGGDPRALNEDFARRRQQIMDDPNLNARQREQALARLSAERAAAGGTPERPGGYRGDQAWAAGLPPPSGRVAGPRE
jgi:hypothetical protein